MPEPWGELREWKHGEACTVIGNGPSLNRVPREFLYKHDTFGTNRVYLKYTPDFYVVVNPLVASQNLQDIIKLESGAKFIGAGMANAVKGSYKLISTGQPIFSLKPWNCIYEGYTVTYVCLQLAYWLGYRTVLLVGVDHRYKFDGKPNEEHVCKSDPNHFDPAYFQGQKWNNPDLAKSEAAYKLAREAFEKDGRRIINLGPDSALEVFERGNLEDW